MDCRLINITEMENELLKNWQIKEYSIFAGPTMVLMLATRCTQDEILRMGILKRAAACNELLEALQDAPIVSKYNNAEEFIEAYEQWRDGKKMAAIKKATV